MKRVELRRCEQAGMGELRGSKNKARMAFSHASSTPFLLSQTSCVNVSGPSSVLLLVSSSASAFSPSQSLARTDYGMAKVERMEHELAASNPFQSAVERMSSDREISALLSECRHNKWGNVLNRVNKNHSLAVAKLPLENHITTTILHQAITSKGNTTERATLILRILEVAPEAAGIPNGYASYPIHCLAQRNTKMNASTKETLLLVSWMAMRLDCLSRLQLI